MESDSQFDRSPAEINDSVRQMIDGLTKIKAGIIRAPASFFTNLSTARAALIHMSRQLTEMEPASSRELIDPSGWGLREIQNTNVRPLHTDRLCSGCGNVVPFSSFEDICPLCSQPLF